MKVKVVTYQAPNGDTIDLTPEQIAAYEQTGEWPKNRRGEEYCTVSHGLHETHKQEENQ